MTDIYTYKCSICGKETTGFGNDPRPIIDNESERCCDDCNNNYVIPMKILNIYLKKIASVKEVVIRFDGFYVGIKRRFHCWEYWVADDNEDNIEQGVYDDSFAPMTKVIKDLMEKYHISPSGFELLEPDPYYLMGNA